MRLERGQPGPNEVLGYDGTPRPLYRPVLDEMERMGPAEWDHRIRRAHALAPDADTVEVVPGAMTRVAAPGSKLVNISSGGKMKDTWVLGA